MDLISLFIELMEPRTVLGVGIIIAFGVSGFLAVQAKMSTGYRWLFSVLSLSVSLAGTSLFASLILFEDLTFRYTLFVRLIGTTSYLLGMYSLVLLYRPAFPRSIFVLFALLSMTGYALWTTPGAARNWNMVCQFTIAVFTLAVVTRARDDLAPNTRWLSICLCLFSACGLLPSLFAILATGMDPGPGPISLDSPMRRVAILFWAVSPMAVYAVVTGVIHARIASKLKRAIDLDVLTGAYSRRYLFERGEQLLKQRTNEAPPGLGVLLIDVDHFKQVNDQWGHAIGDEVLKYLVRQVKEVVRVSDAVVARYGGEEFVVLVPTQDQALAQRLAERIRSHLKANPFRAAEVHLPVTVSIGVASNRGRETLNSVIHQADECLYRAKKAGRDQVVFQGSMLVPV